MRVRKITNKKHLKILFIILLIIFSVGIIGFGTFYIINVLKTAPIKQNLYSNYKMNDSCLISVYKEYKTLEIENAISFSSLENKKKKIEVYNPFGRKLNIEIEDLENKLDEDINNEIIEILKNDYNYSDTSILNSKIRIYNLIETHYFEIQRCWIQGNQIGFEIIFDTESFNVISNYKLSNNELIINNYSTDLGQLKLYLDLFLTKANYFRVSENHIAYSVLRFNDYIVLTSES